MRKSSLNIKRSNRAQGYVLVMALLLIAMAGSVLTIMAKRSIFEATDVYQAQKQLQHRWATYSLEKSLLPNASNVMTTLLENDPPDDQDLPVNKIDFNIQLGDTTYQLTLSDEQAKANVNQLFKSQSQPTDVTQTVRSLLEKRQIRNIPTINLKPFTWESDTQEHPIQTLGQMFENVNLEQLMPFDSEEPAVLDVVTCWGDGKLNFRQAPIEVIISICLKSMTRGEIDKLINARKTNPEISLEKALVSAGIDKKKLDQVKALFTETSNCHTLWSRWQDTRRLHHRLAVGLTLTANKKSESQTDTPQHAKIQTLVFAW